VDGRQGARGRRLSWAHFAKRYRGIGNERVSFDLLNEPADIKAATYAGWCGGWWKPSAPRTRNA
jgi:hypothetical protein